MSKNMLNAQALKKYCGLKKSMIIFSRYLIQRDVFINPQNPIQASPKSQINES